MPDSTTDQLIVVLRSQPEYVMHFMADFGGDPSDYIEVPEGEELDFGKITLTQVGESMRMFVERHPPAGTPADLNLDSIDWTAVGEGIEQILASYHSEV